MNKDIKKEGDTQRTALTFGELAEMWLQTKENIVKHSTYLAYIFCLKHHLLPRYGEAVEIEEEDAQQYITEHLAKGVAKKTIRDHIATLRAVLRFGERRGLYSHREWRLEYPRDRKNNRVRALSLAHHRKLSAYLEENLSCTTAPILIALYTGMRVGEVCGLRWEDIDLQRRVLHVSRTRSYVWNVITKQCETYEDTPKTKNSDREIPISNSLYSALCRLRKQRDPELFPYVVGSTNKGTNNRNINETLRRILFNLKLPLITFHGLRHTFATRLVESKCDIKTVSTILGHSTVATTLNLYVHPDTGQKRKALAKLNRLIGSDNP